MTKHVLLEPPWQACRGCADVSNPCLYTHSQQPKVVSNVFQAKLTRQSLFRRRWETGKLDSVGCEHKVAREISLKLIQSTPAPPSSMLKRDRKEVRAESDLFFASRCTRCLIPANIEIRGTAGEDWTSNFAGRILTANTGRGNRVC